MVEVQGPAEIVIVTGLSGAGRRTAAHTMEDLGWYVVDNLPPAMLPILVDRMGMTERLAVVVDVRSREEFEQLPTSKYFFWRGLHASTSQLLTFKSARSPEQHSSVLTGISRLRKKSTVFCQSFSYQCIDSSGLQMTIISCFSNW